MAATSFSPQAIRSSLLVVLRGGGEERRLTPAGLSQGLDDDTFLHLINRTQGWFIAFLTHHWRTCCKLRRACDTGAEHLDDRFGIQPHFTAERHRFGCRKNVNSDKQVSNTFHLNAGPTNHVIGVFNDMQEAEQAVQALQNAVYAAQDILLIPSQTFIEGAQKRRQEYTRFEQAIHIFFTSSDQGFPGEVYLQQARRGAHVLPVYAPTAKKAEQIAQILSNYHVQLLKYLVAGQPPVFPHNLIACIQRPNWISPRLRLDIHELCLYQLSGDRLAQLLEHP